MVEGFQHTEVGSIPNDWVLNKLNNLSSKLVVGFVGVCEPYFTDETNGVLLIRTGNLQGTHFILEGSRYVTKSFHLRNKKSQVRKGDFLIARHGNSGNAVLVPNFIQEANTLNIVIVRIENEDIFNSFVLHAINSEFVKKQVKNSTAGSTQSVINTAAIGNLYIPLPLTKAEQTAIATALNDADTLIQKLEQLIAKKRNIKTGAMQELLKPKEGWQVKSLGEIALFYKGKGLAKSQISTDGKSKCIHYGELFIKYKEQITVVTGKTNDFEGAFYSKVNDVLMPTSDVTPNGLATASCLNEDDVILGGDVLVIRIPNSIVNGSFLSYYIKLNRSEIMKLVKGVTVFHLHASDMKDFVLHFPKIDEQNKIAQILFDMEIEIQSMEKQLEKYKMMKQGMMQSLLTGKIRLV